MNDYIYRTTENKFTEVVGKAYVIQDAKSNAIMQPIFLDKVSADNALEMAKTTWPEAELSIQRISIVTFPKIKQAPPKRQRQTRKK